jgi:2-isopropylmalate synthase
MLKLGFETGVSVDGLKRLTPISHMLDERLNRAPNRHAPYVGESAFAHKGGLHAAAVEKDPATYEHVPPESVGNRRQILVSDQAGRANLLRRLNEVGLAVEAADPRLAALVDLVKQLEHQGYAYDAADASFELLARRRLDQVPDFFKVMSFRVLDERRWTEQGNVATLSEATVRIDVGNQRLMTVAEGNGPVNALDGALRKALRPIYPSLDALRLIDYKVRILTPEAATEAVTRVIIESRDDGQGPNRGTRWSTVGLSTNVIDASFAALHDAVTYKLLRDQLAA